MVATIDVYVVGNIVTKEHIYKSKKYETKAKEAEKNVRLLLVL
mgnify:CR=1 FL=1